MIQNFVHHAVVKILLVVAGAHVREGDDGNGFVFYLSLHLCFPKADVTCEKLVNKGCQKKKERSGPRREEQFLLTKVWFNIRFRGAACFRRMTRQFLFLHSQACDDFLNSISDFVDLIPVKRLVQVLGRIVFVRPQWPVDTRLFINKSIERNLTFALNFQTASRLPSPTRESRPEALGCLHFSG